MKQWRGNVWRVVLKGCAAALIVFEFSASPILAKPWQQYQSPTEAGWSAEKLELCRLKAEQMGSAAVFIVYRGHVLSAWGEVERRFECHSVRKSLLSGLYGFYAGGTIDLQKSLADLGIDDVPPLTDVERQARVIDLLRSRSGVYHPAAKEPPDMKRERPARGSHKPGEHFWYNNWDFNTLGVIFEKVTGKNVFEEFDAKFAKPLCMDDFRLSDGMYELEPSNSIHPAHAFNLSARDLARFGLLYLQNGQWEGKQVIPTTWITESTTIDSPAGEGEGYGYMWWVYPAGCLGKETKLDALNALDKYVARGTGGQFLLVAPGAELVLVNRVDTDNGCSVRGPRIWELAEMVLDARTGSAKPEPTLMAMKPVPLGPVLAAPKERSPIALDPERMKDVLGDWEQEIEPRMHVTVYLHQGRLFGMAKGQGETELFADTPDSYFSKAVNLQIGIQRDSDGRVSHGEMSFKGKLSRIRKVK